MIIAVSMGPTMCAMGCIANAYGDGKRSELIRAASAQN
jgi:hypothetical protein